MTSPTPDAARKLSRSRAPMPSRTARVVRWFCPSGRGSWLVRTNWLRVAFAVTVAVTVGYFSLATAAYAYVRHYREVDAIHWADVAFPWRWSQYHHARGEHLVAQAKRMVLERKFREALLFARAGVSRSPANREGRLLLVDLEDAARRPQAARRTLVEGMSHHCGDPRYVQRVLTRLLREQRDNFVLLLHRRYATRTPHPEAARLLTLGAAMAHHYRGNYDGAEDLLRQTAQLAASRDGRLLAARIEWDRGHRDLAALLLRKLADDYPHDGETHRDLVNRLRLLGRIDEARRRSIEFQIAHPGLAWPRIDLMNAYVEGREPQRLQREIEAFLVDFAADETAVLALADFAANTGDAALVQRLLAHAVSRKWRREAYIFLAIEAQIVAGDFASALAAIRAHRAESAGWDPQHQALGDSLQAVAALGAGDAEVARVHLTYFLSRENLRAENLVAVANRFVALDAPEHALQTLSRALTRDPTNQRVLTRLVELDIVLDRGEELAEHVRQLLKTRRPPADLLRIAQVKLGSDLFVFSPKVALALEEIRRALESGRVARAAGTP